MPLRILFSSFMETIAAIRKIRASCLPLLNRVGTIRRASVRRSPFERQAQDRHAAEASPVRAGQQGACRGRRIIVTMEDSGNRLFVGNMPFRMTRDELYDLFAQAGAVVSVHIPTDRESGRPRGFGFVEMEDPAAIDQAVQMFNGYSVGGRALVVNQARPRESRPQY